MSGFILLFSLTFGLPVFISGRGEVHLLAGYHVKVIAVPFLFCQLHWRTKVYELCLGATTNTRDPSPHK